MKKKQFMSKLAALTMAAMMGLSAVPASAVSVLAETKISADTYTDQEVTTSTAIDTTHAGDGKNAVDAVTAAGSKSIDLADVTDAAHAKTAIGSNIKATTINGSRNIAATTVTVDSFTAATGDAADKQGSMTGTATWTVNDATRSTSGSFYDITINVPFTATWTQTQVTSKVQTWTVDTTKVTGVKTTYTNSSAKNADNYDGSQVDADNMTTLQQQVKNAIEATDTNDLTFTDPDTIVDSPAATNIKAAVEQATHYNVVVGSLTDEATTVSGTLIITIPQSDGGNTYETVGFTTDKATARQKRVDAAAKAVQTALTGDSDYTVSTDNPIDKVIAQVLADNGYTDVQYASYKVTKSTASQYAGNFTVEMPEVKNTAGTVTAAKVTGTGTFSLNTGLTESSLTDPFINSFRSAIADAPMYDDTEAEELATYLNSDKFTVNGNTLKKSKIRVSNITINGVKDVAHGKTGTADVTLTLTDATGKSVRQSYTISGVQHADSTKLKEATDTVAAVAAKVDTSKAQKKTDTSALPLGESSSAKTNTAITYNATAAGTTSVEALAQKVVKDSLNTVINAKASGTDKKLIADFGSKVYTKDNAVTAADKYAPVIKITKYTPATAAKEGTADVEVTFRTVNDDWTLDDSTGIAATQTATAKFTLTFGQLKAKASTYIELGGTKYMTLYKDDAVYTTDADGVKTKTSGNALSEHVNSTYSFVASNIADGNDPITWTSSDPSVAIVDANGNITAKGLGTTTITATDANDASVSDSVAVVVKNNDAYKFVDVQNPNIFYFSPVYAAAEDEITAGTDATHFSPDADVTRAQFITWLYKKAGSPAVTVTGQFTDVPADKWYTNAVYWALENGITAGTTSTTFSPDQTLTRGQAMMFLYKAYGKGKTYNRELALQFKDVSETSPFAEAINWGLYKGVTKGYTTTLFGIDDPCTRGQAVTFLYNA